jgi:redox-sensitive bicupin YhaK (pirin superfamily)
VVLAAGLGVPAAALGAGAVFAVRGPGPKLRRPRDVAQIVDARASVDGAGVRLRRALGAALPMLDPFLLLDELHSDRPEDYAAGFPTHPHRGFETVTYVLEGAVDHRDSLGNHGHLLGGSVQWMTAGHGIVHSEMPTHDESSNRLWAFQLWVNLPASRKMVRPRYQDLSPETVPDVAFEHARVRVVAGEAGGARGPVEGIITEPTWLDVLLAPRGESAFGLPEGHGAFLYVIEGAADVGPAHARVAQGQLAALGPGDGVRLESSEGARALLIAGRPIGEPVARSGPFVMNTAEELRQAWEDYRAGRLVQPG